MGFNQSLLKEILSQRLPKSGEQSGLWSAVSTFV